MGRYDNQIDAAIAYNKAADLLESLEKPKKYIKNYIEDINNIEYAKRYNIVKISDKIRYIQ